MKLPISMIVAATCLLGCGTDPGVTIAPVSGRVTLDGKPLEGAYVEFLPKGGGRPSGGITDSDGRYTLQYSVHDSGALVGAAKVLVTTGDPENPRQRPERIPARYHRDSILEVDVDPDRTEYNFELTK